MVPNAVVRSHSRGELPNPFSPPTLLLKTGGLSSELVLLQRQAAAVWCSCPEPSAGGHGSSNAGPMLAG